MKFSKILYPTDFSKPSQKAFAYVQEMALRYNASLHVIHITPNMMIFPVEMPVSPEAFVAFEDAEKSAKKEMEKLKKKINPKLKVQTLVTQGLADEQILKYAKKNKIDLIVMGSHGRRGIERLLLGSTTESVIRKSRMPVLVIR